jgi:hypothetical protein
MGRPRKTPKPPPTYHDHTHGAYGVKWAPLKKDLLEHQPKHVYFHSTLVGMLRRHRPVHRSKACNMLAHRASTSSSHHAMHTPPKPPSLDSANAAFLTRSGRQQLGAVLLMDGPNQQVLPPLERLAGNNSVGVWQGPSVDAKFINVLGLLGQHLEESVRVVPTHLHDFWDQNLERIVADVGLGRDVVHNAMLIQYPLGLAGPAGGMASTSTNPAYPAPHLWNDSYCSTLNITHTHQLGASNLDMLASVAVHQSSQQPTPAPRNMHLKKHGYVYLKFGLDADTRQAVMLYAHRFVLFACVGLPPIDVNLGEEEFKEEMKRWYAMHVCDNKLCVNFKHLYWGRAADNHVQKATPQKYREMISHAHTHQNRTWHLDTFTPHPPPQHARPGADVYG